MPNYEVKYKIVQFGARIVEAENPSAAEDLVREEFDQGLLDTTRFLGDDERLEVKTRQVGEPWIRGGWHSDEGHTLVIEGRHIPVVHLDLLLFYPSYGNVFVNEDRALMSDRVEAEGFKVIEAWGGTAGCDSMSIRVEGREGRTPLTEQQLARLFAPRPTQPA